jgi:hypothetical protein
MPHSGRIEKVVASVRIVESSVQVQGAKRTAHQAFDGTANDAIHVHVTLAAVMDDGSRISTLDPVIGCSVQAGGSHVGGSWSTEVEELVRIVLGLGSHKPPRLSWQPLIARLANYGFEVDEAQLMTLPLRMEFPAGAIAR